MYSKLYGEYVSPDELSMFFQQLLFSISKMTSRHCCLWNWDFKCVLKSFSEQQWEGVQSGPYRQRRTPWARCAAVRQAAKRSDQAKGCSCLMKTDEAEIKCLPPLGAPFITVSLGALEHLVQGLLPPYILPSCCSRHAAVARGQPQTSHYKTFPKQWVVMSCIWAIGAGYCGLGGLGSRISPL